MGKHAEIKYKELVRTACELFKQKGYHGTSMQDIAIRLNTLKGSLYYYISCKEDLLIEILNSTAVKLEVVEKLKQENPDPVEYLKAIIEFHINFVAEYENEYSVCVEQGRYLSKENKRESLKMFKQYEEILQNAITRCIDSGQFKNIDPRLTTLGLLGMLNWIFKWYSREGNYSVKQISEHFIDFIFLGLVK